MEKIFTEDDYIRCDIVTGRLYRCLTSLFQEFLDTPDGAFANGVLYTLV